MDEKSLADLKVACNRFPWICSWAEDASRLSMGCGKGRWPRKVQDHVGDGDAQQNHKNHIADSSHYAATANVVTRKSRENTRGMRGMQRIFPGPA